MRITRNMDPVVRQNGVKIQALWLAGDLGHVILSKVHFLYP